MFLKTYSVNRDIHVAIFLEEHIKVNLLWSINLQDKARPQHQGHASLLWEKHDVLRPQYSAEINQLTMNALEIAPQELGNQKT